MPLGPIAVAEGSTVQKRDHGSACVPQLPQVAMLVLGTGDAPSPYVKKLNMDNLGEESNVHVRTESVFLHTSSRLVLLSYLSASSRLPRSAKSRWRHVSLVQCP